MYKFIQKLRSRRVYVAPARLLNDSYPHRMKTRRRVDAVEELHVVSKSALQSDHDGETPRPIAPPINIPSKND